MASGAARVVGNERPQMQRRWLLFEAQVLGAASQHSGYCSSLRSHKRLRSQHHLG